ncbi:hypothetical protein ACTHP3_20820 [Shouchella rhizosphaerae]
MSTTTLKIIALCAMFIDHIGQFFPETPDGLIGLEEYPPLFLFIVLF